MPYDYKVEDGYVAISLRGVVTVSDLHEIAELFHKIETTTGTAPHRMTKMSGAEEVRVHFAEMNDYVTKRRSIKLKNDVRSAFVATTQLHFGLARMFQNMNQNPQITVAIFPDAEAAARWLRRADKPSEVKPPSQPTPPTHPPDG